ncbi:hypothetical protein BD779DRAFT_1680152 [Infundibulicybe gibba]|nr:hypothetical protein BD779DRAFT_1680152 [Infundibulicybe gibba]
MPPKTPKATSRTPVKKGTTAPRATPTNSSPSKRKVIFISDGSASEVDSTALSPSPSKKAKFTSRCPVQEGVTLMISQASLLQALRPSEPGIRRKLSFGSLSPDTGENPSESARHDDQSKGVPPSTRPVRTKIPTEKALFSSSLRKPPVPKPKKGLADDDIPVLSDSDVSEDVFLPPKEKGSTRSWVSTAVTPPPVLPHTLSPEVPEPPTIATILPPMSKASAATAPPLLLLTENPFSRFSKFARCNHQSRNTGADSLFDDEAIESDNEAALSGEEAVSLGGTAPPRKTRGPKM